MKFTLYFTGRLPSASASARLREKHDIRKHLHPQLLQLFRTHPALPKFIRHPDDTRTALGPTDWADWPRWEWPNFGDAWFEEQAVHPVGDIKCVPLVRSNMSLIAELDVLFLRHGEPGAIFQSGDLDNRILTLSDGLRLPKGQNEEAFMTNDTGISRTSPFFCLLEDDSLITRWNVRTDRLLEEERDRANVQLIIEVTVKATRLTWGNIAMASG